MSFTKIIAILLVVILALSALSIIDFGGETPNDNNSVVIKPSDTPEEPDEPTDEEGDTNGDSSGDNTEDNTEGDNSEEITYTTLVSADRLILGNASEHYIYTSEDGSEYVKTLASLTQHTLSEDSTVITNNYFNTDTTDLKFSGNNYIELTFPNHESGIYSIEYTVNYYGAMPSVKAYLKSQGLLNNFDIVDFLPGTEHAVDYSSDIGYTINYVISFDFDNNYCSVYSSNVSGDYELDIFDISPLASENTDGVLKDIQYRTVVQAENAIPQDYEKQEIINFMYKYHPEGSSIIPDEYVEDNAGVVIEGDYQVLASDTLLSLNNGSYTLADSKSITTDNNLTDYQMQFFDEVGEWPYVYDYIGPTSGYYGENAFNIHLPNYESGTYVFSMALNFTGSTSFFYPTAMNFYLKTPGYVNTTHIFNIDKTKVSLAKLAGYEFENSNGGSFTMEYIFDFDNDIINCNLVDLNGKSYSLGEQSLDKYRSWVNPDTGGTVNTKDLPITLRLQIPADTYEVNTNNTSIGFYTWSFKKLIENT